MLSICLISYVKYYLSLEPSYSNLFSIWELLISGNYFCSKYLRVFSKKTLSSYLFFIDFNILCFWVSKSTYLFSIFVAWLFSVFEEPLFCKLIKVENLNYLLSLTRALSLKVTLLMKNVNMAGVYMKSVYTFAFI